MSVGKPPTKKQGGNHENAEVDRFSRFGVFRDGHGAIIPLNHIIGLECAANPGKKNEDRARI